MRILMLTPYVPFPPSSGGQIRTYNILKYLAKNNKIMLVCLYKNDEEKKYLKQLQPYCESIHFCRRTKRPWQIKTILKSLLSRKPFLIVRNYSTEAEAILKTLIENERFDIIHAETFYIMPHLPPTAIPIFLVEQTIEYEVYRHFVHSLPFFLRPFFYLDILKLEYWEKSFWKKAYLVGAVSESDREVIQRTEPEIKTTLIPNGAGDEMIAFSLPKKNLTQPVAIFFGNFSWLQNTEAVHYLIKNIYPHLERKLPQLKIIVAGQDIHNKLDKIKAKNIEIIEIKPDDYQRVKKIYDRASIFLAPILGPGGTRLKILAAMASGLVVVSTKTGIEGLKLTDEQDVLIAHHPREFADKIEKVLLDKALYEKIRKNAYTLIKTQYNWKMISKQLESIYQNIVTSP